MRARYVCIEPKIQQREKKTNDRASKRMNEKNRDVRLTTAGTITTKKVIFFTLEIEKID